jgi:hypothetical protein
MKVEYAGYAGLRRGAYPKKRRIVSLGKTKRKIRSEQAGQRVWHECWRSAQRLLTSISATQRSIKVIQRCTLHQHSCKTLYPDITHPIIVVLVHITLEIDQGEPALHTAPALVQDSLPRHHPSHHCCTCTHHIGNRIGDAGAHRFKNLGVDQKVDCC